MKKNLKRLSALIVAAILCTTAGNVPMASAASTENILINCNFDELDADLSKWAINAQDDGAGIAIAKDPVSGSNALKITHPWRDGVTSGDTPTSATYDITKDLPAGTSVNDGIFKVSYDIRFANHTVSTSNLLYSTGWAAPGWNVGTHSTRFKVANAFDWSTDHLGNNSEIYYKVEQTIDFNNSIYRARILKNNAVMIDSGMKGIDWARNFSNIGKIQFSAVNDTVRGAGNTRPENTLAEYYIDNIKVERAAPEIISTSITDGANNISAKAASVQAVFLSGLNQDTVNTSTVGLYKNGSKISDNYYSVSYKDAEITVNTANLDYNSSYRLVFGKGIKNVNGIGMSDEYSITFNTEENPNIIAKCDFDNLLSLPNSWSVSVAGMGAAEIAEDPVSGSKALKITQTASETPSGNATNVDYTVSKEFISGKTADSGIIKVGYDIRFANHTVTFANGGLLYSSGWAAPGWNVGTYSSNFKVCNIFDPDNYSIDSNTGYYHIEQIVDFDNSTYQAKVYQNGKLKIESEKNAISENRNFKNIGILNFKAVDDSTRPEYNSSNTAGEYYIDNITVEKFEYGLESFSIVNNAKDIALDRKIIAKFNDTLKASDVNKDNFKLYKNNELISGYSLILENDSVTFVIDEGLDYNSDYKVEIEKNISNSAGNAVTVDSYTYSFKTQPYSVVKSILSMDFEDFDIGTLKSGSGITVNSVYDNDSLDIVEDVYGSKAIRIKRSESNLGLSSATDFTINFDTPVNNGTIKVSYDIRSANYRAGMTNVGTVEGTGNAAVNKMFMYDKYLYPIYGEIAYPIPDNIANTSYLTVERTIDLGTGKFTTKYYRDGVLHLSRDEKQGIAGNANHLRFTAAKYGQDIYSANTGDAEYYIDNIKVDLLQYPEIIWCSPANGNTDAETGGDVILYANERISEASVNKTNITVYAGDTKLDNYSISLQDKKNISVSFDREKGKKYTVNVSGLVSDDANQLVMKNTYSMNFTTKKDISVISQKISNSADNSAVNYYITLENNLGNNTPYNAFVALYKGNNVLSGVTSFDGVFNNREYINVSGTISKDNDLSDNAHMKMFLWDSPESMIPLNEALQPNLPSARTYGSDTLSDSSKTIKVAYIGGSLIEQGYITAALNKHLENDIFPDRNIEYITAGVGGTGSKLQMFRVYNDVIKFSPDIVFVDATVNDATTSDAGETFEAVIRQLMLAEKQPVVVRLAFGTQSGTWKQADEKHQAVCEYYGIKSVNVGSYIEENIADENNTSGKYVWKTADTEAYPNATAITNSDGIHPNAPGGEVYAKYITDCLKANYTDYFKNMSAKDVPCNTNKYDNARMIPWYDGVYTGNWYETALLPQKFKDGVAVSSEEGSTVTFKFYGKAFALYGIGGKYGLGMTYSVDGGEGVYMNAFLNGLDSNQAGPTQIVELESEGYHTITISVGSSDEAGAAFKLGYFMVY